MKTSSWRPNLISEQTGEFISAERGRLCGARRRRIALGLAREFAPE